MSSGDEIQRLIDNAVQNITQHIDQANQQSSNPFSAIDSIDIQLRTHPDASSTNANGFVVNFLPPETQTQQPLLQPSSRPSIATDQAQGQAGADAGKNQETPNAPEQTQQPVPRRQRLDQMDDATMLETLLMPAFQATASREGRNQLINRLASLARIAGGDTNDEPGDYDESEFAESSSAAQRRAEAGGSAAPMKTSDAELIKADEQLARKLQQQIYEAEDEERGKGEEREEVPASIAAVVELQAKLEREKARNKRPDRGSPTTKQPEKPSNDDKPKQKTTSTAEEKKPAANAAPGTQEGQVPPQPPAPRTNNEHHTEGPAPSTGGKTSTKRPRTTRDAPPTARKTRHQSQQDATGTSEATKTQKFTPDPDGKRKTHKGWVNTNEAPEKKTVFDKDPEVEARQIRRESRVASARDAEARDATPSRPETGGRENSARVVEGAVVAGSDGVTKSSEKRKADEDVDEDHSNATHKSNRKKSKLGSVLPPVDEEPATMGVSELAGSEHADMPPPVASRATARSKDDRHKRTGNGSKHDDQMEISSDSDKEFNSQAESLFSAMDFDDEDSNNDGTKSQDGAFNDVPREVMQSDGSADSDADLETGADVENGTATSVLATSTYEERVADLKAAIVPILKEKLDQGNLILGYAGVVMKLSNGGFKCLEGREYAEAVRRLVGENKVAVSGKRSRRTIMLPETAANEPPTRSDDGIPGEESSHEDGIEATSPSQAHRHVKRPRSITKHGNSREPTTGHGNRHRHPTSRTKPPPPARDQNDLAATLQGTSAHQERGNQHLDSAVAGEDDELRGAAEDEEQQGRQLVAGQQEQDMSQNSGAEQHSSDPAQPSKPQREIPARKSEQTKKRKQMRQDSPAAEPDDEDVDSSPKKKAKTSTKEAVQSKATQMNGKKGRLDLLGFGFLRSQTEGG